MESYNSKRQKLLKLQFFINLRKKIIFLRAHFFVIKQNVENIVEFFLMKITEKSYIFFDE